MDIQTQSCKGGSSQLKKGTKLSMDIQTQACKGGSSQLEKGTKLSMDIQLLHKDRSTYQENFMLALKDNRQCAIA